MMIKELICEVNSEKIYGLAYLPDNIENKIPIVILSHGLSLNHTVMIPYAEKLLKNGIASYVFDFRGGGYDSKSDGLISDMSIDSEVADLNAVIDMIKNQDFVDINNIYLGGHSQGGLVSSLVAPNRDDVKSLFLFAPAYVIPTDVKEDKSLRKQNVLNLMPEHLGDTYINSAKRINLYDDITGYTNPVYLFHGKKDERVPLDYIIEANDSYANSKLVVFEDEAHRFSDKTKDYVVKVICDVVNSH